MQSTWSIVFLAQRIGEARVDECGTGRHPYSLVAPFGSATRSSLNPVDFEQCEGRVNRFVGHAVRKDAAEAHWGDMLRSTAARA